jgi:predicted NBD/HSP70 family sugar kinase
MPNLGTSPTVAARKRGAPLNNQNARSCVTREVLGQLKRHPEKLRAMVTTLINRAIKGDHQAMALLWEKLEPRGVDLDGATTTVNIGSIVIRAVESTGHTIEHAPQASLPAETSVPATLVYPDP